MLSVRGILHPSCARAVSGILPVSCILYPVSVLNLVSGVLPVSCFLYSSGAPSPPCILHPSFSCVLPVVMRPLLYLVSCMPCYPSCVLCSVSCLCPVPSLMYLSCVLHPSSILAVDRSIARFFALPPGALPRPAELEKRVEPSPHARVEVFRPAHPGAQPLLLPRRHAGKKRLHPRRMTLTPFHTVLSIAGIVATGTIRIFRANDG